MNILVLEHILFYSDAIQAAFFRRGHTCFLVNTTEDAISYTNILSFDLVVIDNLVQDSAVMEELLYNCSIKGNPVILVSDDQRVELVYSGYGIERVIPRNKLLVYSFMDDIVSELETKNKLTGVL